MTALYTPAQQTEQETARIIGDTVDTREIAGFGMVRKVRYECPRCYTYQHSFVPGSPELLPCDECTFRLDTAGDNVMVIADDADLLEAELGRFHIAFPLVEKAVRKLVKADLKKTPGGSLFPLGPIHRPRGGAHSGPDGMADPIPDSAWKDAVARHASGDHGLFGTMAGTAPTADELWAARAFPIATRNYAAIAAKRGLIRSRFTVPDEHVHRLGECHLDRGETPPGLPPAPPRVLGVLDVATLVRSATEAITWCRLGHVGQQCFMGG